MYQQIISNPTLILHFRRSRWFILPWLIYDMLMVVGLSLVAVLLIVIPMGSFNSDHNWTIIGLKACLCLAVAGLFLYFWIVVLELFLKMGPFLMFDPAMMPPGPPQVPPGTNYPLMYPNTQMYPSMQYPGPPITQQPMYAQYGREKPFWSATIYKVCFAFCFYELLW